MENSALRSEVEDLQEDVRHHSFSLKRFKDSDSALIFYTGFPDYSTLETFYDVCLSDSASNMRQWRGKHTSADPSGVRPGPKPALPPMEQFFVVLARLRLGLQEQDLADRLLISQSVVSAYTRTWLNLLYHVLTGLQRFPARSVIQRHMPECFKALAPRTRVIIDCKEFRVETPSSFAAQSATWSDYKNANTAKVLIGVTPRENVSFISPTFDGSISDTAITEASGLVDLLDDDDEVMVDKGFTIQPLLDKVGCRLVAPPKLKGDAQMSASDVHKTQVVANLRIHVERAILRLSHYRILCGPWPATMWDVLHETVTVCTLLTNFLPPLVA